MKYYMCHIKVRNDSWSKYSTSPVEADKIWENNLIWQTVYLPYMLFCAAAVPVHCAANEEETADNVHNSHFILRDQKACLHQSTRNDSEDGSRSTVVYLKHECIFKNLICSFLDGTSEPGREKLCAVNSRLFFLLITTNYISPLQCLTYSCR